MSEASVLGPETDFAMNFLLPSFRSTFACSYEVSFKRRGANQVKQLVKQFNCKRNNAFMCMLTNDAVGMLFCKTMYIILYVLGTAQSRTKIMLLFPKTCPREPPEQGAQAKNRNALLRGRGVTS